jgi:hypothetical protein
VIRVDAPFPTLEAVDATFRGEPPGHSVVLVDDTTGDASPLHPSTDGSYRGTELIDSATTTSFQYHFAVDGVAGGELSHALTPSEAAAGVAQVTAGAPIVVTGVAPNAAGAGATLQVVVAGSGFATGDMPTVSGSGVTLTSVVVLSSYGIQAQLSAAANATAGARNIVVTDPITGLSGSCTGCMTIDPAPSPVSVSPGSLQTGASGVTVTVNGAGFQPGTTKLTLTGPSTLVKAKSVTYVSGTQLTVKLSVGSGAALGSYTVKIVNPDGGVGRCTACFTVTQGPVLSSIAPSVVTRSSTQSVTLSGNFFAAGATVSGPTGVTFSNVVVSSATTITATITVSPTAPTGTNLTVTVLEPLSVGAGRGSCACLTVK